MWVFCDNTLHIQPYTQIYEYIPDRMVSEYIVVYYWTTYVGIIKIVKDVLFESQRQIDVRYSSYYCFVLIVCRRLSLRYEFCAKYLTIHFFFLAIECWMSFNLTGLRIGNLVMRQLTDTDLSFRNNWKCFGNTVAGLFRFTETIYL